LFINTLPVRVRVPAAAPLSRWLSELQDAQVELRQHEYTSLAQIQRWSPAPAGRPLFETLFVFENYPVDPDVGREAPSLEISRLRSVERTNYPLTATAVPGDRLLWKLSSLRSRFDAPSMQRALRQLETLLAAMATAPEVRLGDLPLL